MLVVVHRMNCSGVAVFLAVVALTAAHGMLLDKWHSWKERHKKLYSTVREEEDRKQTWLTNVREILRHNSGNHTFVMQPNQFCDMVSHYIPSVPVSIAISCPFQE